MALSKKRRADEGRQEAPADSEMQTAVERAKVADRTKEVGRQPSSNLIIADLDERAGRLRAAFSLRELSDGLLNEVIESVSSLQKTFVLRQLLRIIDDGTARNPTDTRLEAAEDFRPLEHGQPAQDIDYRKAREIADVLYTVYPQEKTGSTVRKRKARLAQGPAPFEEPR